MVLDGSGPRRALGMAPARTGDRRGPPLAHARLLRRLHRRPDPADLARRRRGAHRRDRPSPRGPDGRRHRNRRAGAGPRRRRDGSARRDRLPPLDRALRRERVPLDRGHLRLRDDRARVPLLRSLRAPAPSPRASPGSSASASTECCARSTRASTTTAAGRGSCSACSLRHVRRPDGAGARHLGLPPRPSASSSRCSSTTSWARFSSSCCSCPSP